MIKSLIVLIMSTNLIIPLLGTADFADKAACEKYMASEVGKSEIADALTTFAEQYKSTKVGEIKDYNSGCVSQMEFQGLMIQITPHNQQISKELQAKPEA